MLIQIKIKMKKSWKRLHRILQMNKKKMIKMKKKKI